MTEAGTMTSFKKHVSMCGTCSNVTPDTPGAITIKFVVEGYPSALKGKPGWDIWAGAAILLIHSGAALKA
jgi:hypothetical protein